MPPPTTIGQISPAGSARATPASAPTASSSSPGYVEKRLGPASGRIRLHNADGSIAEISGNGTRCVAAWMAASLDSQPGDELHIETDAGLRVCRVNAVHTSPGYSVEVTTGMGVPAFAPKTVKLADGCKLSGTEVSTGNPHFVIVGRTTRTSPSTVSLGKHRRRNLHPSRFPAPDQCRVRPRRQSSAKSKSASSSAAWDRRPLPAPAVPHRPPRQSPSASRKSPLTVVCSRRPANHRMERTWNRTFSHRTRDPHRTRRGMVNHDRAAISAPLAQAGSRCPGRRHQRHLSRLFRQP